MFGYRPVFQGIKQGSVAESDNRYNTGNDNNDKGNAHTSNAVIASNVTLYFQKLL